jgi:hypothetical protein
MLPWPRVGGALSGALEKTIVEANAGVKQPPRQALETIESKARSRPPSAEAQSRTERYLQYVASATQDPRRVDSSAVIGPSPSGLASPRCRSMSAAHSKRKRGSHGLRIEREAARSRRAIARPLATTCSHRSHRERRRWQYQR